ncbi:MAG TPA: hypothetical protein VNA14_13030 [Mycobacteriales bacterium]|nr:hypothetical protein [Mycobacteriales bacterium]
MRLALSTAVLMTAAAIVAPGVASAAPRCAEPRVAGPPAGGFLTEEDRQRARRAPVVTVTDRHDVRHPVEVRYSHRPGVTAAHYVPTELEDVVFHTVHVVPRSPRTHLWIRVEFSDVATDIDLVVYSRHGAAVGFSSSANNEVLDEAFKLAGSHTNGGPGYENIDGLPTSRCAALTILTKSSIVAVDTPTRLLLWLGPPAPKA